MALFLGTPGRMVELPGAASLVEGVADRYSTRTTLEGRVRAQARPASRRQWQVALPDATTPLENAMVADFVSGAWGRGPWWFVSSDAAVQNVLLPGVASCEPGTATAGTGLTMLDEGGPWLTPDGWAPQSWVKASDGTLYFGQPVPVIAGKPVTASAYVLGDGGAVILFFRDATGATIGSGHTSTVTSTAGTAVRSHITVAAPANAASAWVAVTATTTRTTRPALTWTSTLLEFGHGLGCEKAILTGYSRDLLMAIDTPGWGRYARPSFTIQEVG